MQHGVTCAVSGCTGALNGLFAVVCGVAAKRTLVNGAVGVAVKRHAHVLKVVDDLGRFAAHEFNGVLVAEPVGAFNRVIEVVVPVVFRHIAQRGANTALRCHGMGACGEYFGQNGHVQASAGQL